VAILRPVAARLVVACREGRTVGLRPRQDVVLVRRIAAALHALALLGERGLLVEIVARAVKIGDVLRDHIALRVLPWSLADAVLRVGGRGRSRRLRAEVCAPRLVAGARRGSE